MKRLLRSVALCLAFTLPAIAEETRFFPDKGTDFGAYYYPEHWSEDQWERDIRRMAELGFDFIHYGEFAWAMLEPEDGKFDFSWMDKAVKLAADHGLKVIMSTPSPCPPAWLATAHPEILTMNSNGVRNHHKGSRLTGSLANPIYRQYVARITTEVAKRYGRDTRVWGWQIGNEPHIQGGEDYSPSAEAEFRAWLKRKYGTVEKLNEAWGAAFWSFTLGSFDQVKIPLSNPHAALDFQLYTSEEVARDLNDQARIVRVHSDGRQWITTNYAYFKGLPNVNPFLTRKEHDFASHTMYLTHNRLNSAGDSLSHRLGCGMEFSMGAEIASSVSGYTGIMELQPSQINWGKFNSMPLPGAVRMWLWHSFGMGERFVCTYRFRQPLFGVEHFHHGIIQTDGVSLSHGGADFVKAIGEIHAIQEQLDPQARDPFIGKSRTAFLWSQRNVMDIESYRHHQDWDTWQHLYTYYQGLKRMGVDVVFKDEGDVFDPKETPFFVVPSYQMMSRELIAKLEAYAQAGGHLLLTTRSGLKDERGHLWEAKIQQPIWDLIGAEIEFYDHLPANRPGTVDFNNEAHPWHTWGTVMNLRDGTDSWARFKDQFYADKHAISHRRCGEGGSVTYVGLWSDNWELEYQVLRQLYTQHLGELPYDLPPYVFVEFRQGLRVAVNYTDKTIEVPAPANSRFLIGKRSLPPAGVSVWK